MIATLVKRCGERALRGDPGFITTLDSNREWWLEKMVAKQLQPEAAAVPV